MLIFITGGIKSGKSIFAEKLASEPKKDVYYIATAIVTDDEMLERVKNHRLRRPSSWTTIEESYDFKKLSKLLPDEPTVVLIDCLTTFLTNRLWRDYPELFTEEKKIPVPDLLLQEMSEIAEEFARSKHTFIVVSNEVGFSLIPPTYIGRLFCDLQGKVNQIFAANASNAYLTISGIPLKIK